MVPIHSPSLRDRKEDIPLLIDHFIAYFSEENNYRKKSFSPEALNLLLDYQWKGNVRELRNLVERMLIMCRNDPITGRDLPDYITRRGGEGEPHLLGLGNWKEFKAQSEKCVFRGEIEGIRLQCRQRRRARSACRAATYIKK